MPLFNQITVIGLGLIGGSLAKAIRKNRLSNKIVGFFRNKEKLNRAIKEKLIDEGHLDLKRAICGSDLIILALPINQIIGFMLKINKMTKNRILIIDVGSTKLKITEVADRLKLNFVGTHPLAGSEKRGMDYSSSELFKNSKILITPTKKTSRQALGKIILFWKKLNANVITLSPQQHDKIISHTSHLPHLTSFCLINSIPKSYFKFSASGLEDTTRIALSHAQIWSDIFLSNRKELLNALNSFELQIRKFKKIIASKERKQLFRLLDSSRKKREKID